MISLLSLTLDSFGSYGDAVEIPLDQDGLVYIGGPTGSGKSTIPRAINYLFSKSFTKEVGSIKNLINKVLDNGFSISLKYQVEDNLYVLTEIRDRGSESGLFFTKNGEDIHTKAKDTKGVKQLVEDSLGTTFDEFRSRVFIGQKQVKNLIDGSTTEKSQEVIKIFGLDKYTNVIKLCDSEVKDAKKREKDLKEKVDECTTNLEKTTKDLENASQKLQQVDEATLDGITEQLSTIKDKVSKIRNKKSKATELLGEAKGFEEQKNVIEKTKQEIKEIKNNFESIDTDIDIDDIKNIVSENNKSIAKLESKLESIEDSIKEISSLDNICPVSKEECPIQVPDKFKEKNITEHNKNRECMLSDIDTCKIKVRKDNEKLELVEKKDAYKKDLKSKKSILENYTEDSLDIDVEEQEGVIDKCKTYITKGESKKEKLSDKLSELKEQNSLYAQQEKFKKDTKKIITDLENDLKEANDDLKSIGNEYKLSLAALNVFKKLKMYEIDIILETLNARIIDNLSIISNGKYSAQFESQRSDAAGKKIIDDLDIVVSDGYKKIPLKLASGGQHAQVSLAVMFAVFEVAKMLTDKEVNNLWLDEPFGPISVDIIDNVFEAVVALAKRLETTSIKIISHKDLDEKFFDHAWETNLVNGITHIRF